MPVNVFVADDSDVIRKAIRRFLEGRPEVLIIGEAENCPETIAQVNQLLPDVIVLDLPVVDFHKPAIGFNKHLAGAKIVAITLGIDDVASALAESIGADKLIDKGDLVAELVPAILELAPTKTA